MLAGRLRRPFVPLDDTDRTGRIVLRSGYTIDISSFKGNTLEEDLNKRDFTVNAMAVRLAGVLEGRPSVFDPLNGQKDLDVRKLKALSRQSFRDDPLRILRAYRIAGQFDLEITPETASWIATCPGGLRDVSGERLLYELALILGARSTAGRVSAMTDAGVFGALFPGWTGPAKAALNRRLERMDRLLARDVFLEDHGLYALLSGHDARLPGDRSSNWILRFASLVLFFIPANGVDPALDIVERTADRLKLSNRERRALHHLIFGAKRLLEETASRQTDDEALCRIIRGTKDETPGAALLALVHGTDADSAEAGSLGEVVDRLIRLYGRHRTVRSRGLLLDGTDIMDDLDIPAGPEIGRMLDRLENIQILHDIRTKEEARKLLYDDDLTGVEDA
jgi:tRNA nucleotidyltransferase/poly(A) polymerase